ncbi:tetratricopeptide repeat protein [Hellea balneolensis]|uniref:tetratricopeptide repeat protein n=1 Tax=Hellea balneolensis TaxID=287478 RepID=UPI00040A7280|nr:tetratricopeptide repeat protein [Hellea balneolensis]
MINSVFTKFAALMFVFALILVPAMLLLPNDGIQSAHAQPDPRPAKLVVSDTALSSDDVTSDDMTKDTIIEVASLSLTEDNFDRAIPNTDTAGLIAHANALIAAQKFDQAIQTLNRIQGVDKDRYDVQFLFARVLSWSGQHDEAEDKFQVLRAAYPQNADILVSYGYLKLYQNQHSQAQRIFETVLQSHPNYQDARNGLSKARIAKG